MTLPHQGYKQLATELGMTESAVKVAMHRLRRRFRELLREEVLQTVDEPGKDRGRATAPVRRAREVLEKQRCNDCQDSRKDLGGTEQNVPRGPRYPET